MEKEVIMKLVRPARKAGGDRYEGKVDGEDFVVYFPQTVSRPTGTPLSVIYMKLESR